MSHYPESLISILLEIKEQIEERQLELFGMPFRYVLS